MCRLAARACNEEIRMAAIGAVLAALTVPAGFVVEHYADVPNARTLAKGPDGVFFVGTRTDATYAVFPPTSQSTKARTVKVMGGLRQANGVLYDNGTLYVAEVTRLLRVPNVMRAIVSGKPPEYELVARYPDEARHGWKVIRKGPDGFIYVPVGAPCDTCTHPDPVFSTITRVRPDGTGFGIFAKGIRNSVGFDWHPVTRDLWFTDNGRDNLGDDVPGDELNRASRPGLHFGFPYCHARGVWDPVFGLGHDCLGGYTSPAQVLGAHVASLGMRFYTGSAFPKSYWNQVFVAEHGSWNRSSRVGYRVSLVRLQGNKAVSYEPFLTGFLGADGTVGGQPVDVEVGDDGALYVTDDNGGRIYRVRYVGEQED
jgi:glucose/arabinose dehydrogenase